MSKLYECRKSNCFDVPHLNVECQTTNGKPTSVPYIYIYLGLYRLYRESQHYITSSMNKFLVHSSDNIRMFQNYGWDVGPCLQITSSFKFKQIPFSHYYCLPTIQALSEAYNLFVTTSTCLFLFLVASTNKKNP